jgi:CBS domain-containing protein
VAAGAAGRISREGAFAMATVNDILSRKGGEVRTTTPEALVLDATRAMNQHRIGSLLVLQQGHVVGMFTERDVLTRVVAAGLDPASTRVADVMTTPVAYCTPDTSLDEARTVFTEKRIRHLPVLDGGQLVGIVTGGDILAHDMTSKEQTIRYLEEYIRTP